MNQKKAIKYMPLYMLENIRDNFYQSEYRKDGTCTTYSAVSIDKAIEKRGKKVAEKKKPSIIEIFGL